MRELDNVSMEETDDPVDGDKDKRKQWVVDQGEPRWDPYSY